MSIPLPVTDTIVEAYLKCPRKAWLRLTGVPGQPSEYVALQQTLDSEYRSAALSAWLERRPQATVVKDPPSIGAAKGSEIITGVVVTDEGEALRFTTQGHGRDRSLEREWTPELFGASEHLPDASVPRIEFLGVLARK